MRKRVRAGIVCLALLASVPTSVLAEDWPQWRGPLGNGVSPESGLPTRWGPEKGILWRSPLKGLGVSSPIVAEGLVVVTSQLGRGKVRSGNHPTLSRGEDASEGALGGSRSGLADGSTGTTVFLIEAYNSSSGALVWDFRFDAEGDLPEVHSKNNMATPSCTSDRDGFYCWFGTGQLVALGLDGTRRWTRSLAQEYGPFEISWGHSSSPTVFQNRLYLLCDHTAASYLVALDTRTGKEIWKVDRGSSLRSYSTPMIVDGPAGIELLVNSSEGLDAYNPVDGRHLWSLEGANRFPVPSPSFGDETIFTSRGYRSGPYMAIRPGGRGDISKTHVLWRVETGAPYVTSIVYYRGRVFMVNGSGIATAIDGTDGKTLWKSRVGGVYSASPVAGDGKVYLTSEGGDVTVLNADGQPSVIAKNPLGERVLASPAISEGRLFFRTDESLICVDGR